MDMGLLNYDIYPELEDSQIDEKKLETYFEKNGQTTLEEKIAFLKQYMCIVYDGYFPKNNEAEMETRVEQEEKERKIYKEYVEMFLDKGWKKLTNKYILDKILRKQRV